MLREMAYAKKKQKASWINDDLYRFTNGKILLVVVVLLVVVCTFSLSQTLRYQVIHAP